MTFDFYRYSPEGVAQDCSPMANPEIDEWEEDLWQPPDVDYWAADLTELELRWVAGANVNGHHWGFKTNGHAFQVTYTNDLGKLDEIVVELGPEQPVERLPDPFDFERNVAFALHLLYDPAVLAYNEQLQRSPAPPIEPMPEDTLELVLEPNGRWQRLGPYGRTSALDDQETPSEPPPDVF